MEVTDQQRRLLELCAIRVDGVSVDWSLIARQAQDPSGLDDLFRGVITEKSAAATRSRPVLTAGLYRLPALADVSAELEAASSAHGLRPGDPGSLVRHARVTCGPQRTWRSAPGRRRRR